VILNYTLTEREYLDALSTYNSHLAPSGVLVRVALPAALGAAIAGIYAFAAARQLLAVTLLVMAAGLLFGRIFWRKWHGRPNLREHSELLGPFGVELTPEGIRPGPEQLHLYWFDFTRYYESRNAFLLLGPSGELYILPKRAFPVGDATQCVQTFRTGLKGKGRRENPDSVLLKVAATWAVLALFLLTLFIGDLENLFAPALRRSTPRSSASPRAEPSVQVATPASVQILEGHGRVYLVPLGKPQTLLSPALLAFFRKKYGLELKLLAPVPLPPWTRDESRNQLISEELVEAMKRGDPQLALDPDSILIGLTDQDMYISEATWTYAFSWRQEERFAVISTARMDPVYLKQAADPKVLESRARKMLTKDIGLLYYHLQPSNDYSSVLYNSIADEEDLDDMGEDYLTADAQFRAERHLEDGDPCFVIRHYYTPAKARSDAGMLSGCSGTVKELNLEIMEIDLRYGLFLDRRTEFYTNDTIPLQFTRVMRTQDSQSRAFGIGGTHNLNIFPVGDRWPFTWMDLILADGGRVHYRRSNWGFGYWDAIYSESDFYNNAFSGSRISWDWPGWKLAQTNGRIYYFPDADHIRRYEQAALVGIGDRAGNRLILPRDEAGNLIRARSPSGVELDFNYDSRDRITEIHDRGGERFQYAYDERGRLASVRDPDGQLTGYSYDGSNPVTSIRQNGSLIVKNDYDSAGRVIRQTLPSGRSYTFTYAADARGAIGGITVMDSAGLIWDIYLSGRSQYTMQPRRAK